MSGAIVIPAGGGEIVGDSRGRRVEILSDDETLNATWSRYGPHRDGADLHIHREHTDLFYVLDGELTMRLGVEDEAVAVPAGRLVRVPPLVVHGFRNASDADVSYVNLHAPGRRFTDYLRAMRDGRDFTYDQHAPPPDGGRSLDDAVVGHGELLADLPNLRVSLLADIEEVGIADVWGASGDLAPPLHVHLRHVESFYVLDGELKFTVGGDELRAATGAWVQIPRGVPHTFVFGVDGPARFLNLHTPSSGFGAFMRRLLAARNEDEVAAARAAFDQVPA